MKHIDEELKRLGFIKGATAKPYAKHNANELKQKGVGAYQLVFYRDVGEYTTLFIEGRLTIYESIIKKKDKYVSCSDMRYTFYKSTYNTKLNQMQNTKVYAEDLSARALINKLEGYIFYMKNEQKMHF
ncbi:hypothetical protein ACYRE2_10105 [Listeria seeligeri]